MLRRLAFILIAMLNLISLASSALLYYRTRYIYKAEYKEVHQHDESMARAHRSPALNARADQPPASPNGRELSSFRR